MKNLKLRSHFLYTMLVVVIFTSCSSSKLTISDCQRRNLTTLFIQKMEVGKIYKVNLCGEYFDYSFNGKLYTLKRCSK